MAVGSNGNTSSPPTRQVRVDQRPWLRALGRPHSGRRFVVLAVVVLLTLWLTLFLVFRDWRARYRARTQLGQREVSAALLPLARIVPPEVAPDARAEMVDQTRDMLAARAGPNSLDPPAMHALG